MANAGASEFFKFPATSSGLRASRIRHDFEVLAVSSPEVRPAFPIDECIRHRNFNGIRCHGMNVSNARAKCKRHSAVYQGLSLAPPQFPQTNFPDCSTACCVLDVQNLAQVFHGVGNVADGFWQHRAGGVGVAAALEFFRHLERLAVAAAEAGEDDVVPRRNNVTSTGYFTACSFEQLMDDEIVVADDGVHVADGRADFA